MSLENRLRNHLHHQSDALDVNVPGSASIAARARARRQQRQSVVVAVFALTLLGIGGWLVGALGDGETSTLEVAESTDDATTPTDSASSAGQAEGTTDDTTIDGTAEDQIVRPEPGTPLTFTSVEDDRSPGGWNVATSGQAGGLYYVLSTSPAAGREQVSFTERQPNDTLYTWADGEWRTDTFADRFISNVSASNGLLYSISTGTRTGSAGLEVGTSSDGGTTWTWAPVDLSEQFGDDATDWPGYSAKAAPTDNGQLVVVSRASGADWQEGVQLAQDAGLDVSFDTHVIYGVDPNGITYGPFGTNLNECAQAFETAILESGVYEGTDGIDVPADDATPAELDAYAAQLEAARVVYRSAADAILADLALRPECAEHVECQRAAFAWNDRVRAETDALFAELGINQFTNYWPTLTDAEKELLEKRQADIVADGPDDPEGVNCEDELYGSVGEAPEPITVTWDSLGVTPPAEWAGSVAAYLVDASGSRLIDTPFRPGYVDSVEATAVGFAVRISELTGDDAPAITEWAGVPGGEWVERPVTGGTGSNIFAGAAFGLDWTTPSDDGPTLLRRDATSTTRMRLEDLAPEVTTDGFQLHAVETGGYGVVAIAGAFGADDPDGDAPGIFRNSIVLYSSDGVTWGATELPGVEVTAVIVGDDGVMVFTTSPALVGTTVPRPVLLGS